MKTLGLVLATLVVAVPATRAQSPDPEAIVGRASRIYRNLNSLKADFVQTIQDRVQGDTLVSRGVVIQARNNLFAMRFSEPKGEAIVVDGKYVWTYTPSTAPNQVYRNPLPTDPIYGVNLLAALLDRPHDRYRTRYLTRETIDGRATDVVELVPVSEDAGFRKAVLWLDVDDALPRKIELDEGPGLRRSLSFTRLQPNAPYNRKTFEFDVPPGVRITEG